VLLNIRQADILISYSGYELFSGSPHYKKFKATLSLKNFIYSIERDITLCYHPEESLLAENGQFPRKPAL